MNNLFEVARKGSEDEIIRACKENIVSVIMRNEDGNPLHKEQNIATYSMKGYL